MGSKKSLLAGVAGLGIIFVLGAAWAWWNWFSGPAAATPYGITVSILNAGGMWTTVGPNPAGAYEVLPTGIPTGSLNLYFYAPSQTHLAVDIDGQALPQIAGGGGSSASGHFRILNVNSTLNPAIWKVEIQPPASKLNSTSFVINVADVSYNRTFSGTDFFSNPASIKLVARRNYTITITMSGMGQGMVTSNPPGIQCPPSCVFDFGQSVTVTLTPAPSGSSTFDGWSGACSGNQNCQLTLNGTAFGANAAFRPTSTGSNQNPMSCPAPNPPPNTSYYGPPLCSGQNVYNDPSPDLECNSQKYFCCAKVQGAQGGDCGVDHQEFRPSCDFGNTHIGPDGPPTGCYIDN